MYIIKSHANILFTDWASVATISVLPAIEGFPFSNVKSVVDGSLANSTGVPYFYMAPMDFTAKDLSVSALVLGYTCGGALRI